MPSIVRSLTGVAALLVGLATLQAAPSGTLRFAESATVAESGLAQPSFALAPAAPAPLPAIWTDPADASVVGIAAGYVADDIARVTGRRLTLIHDAKGLAGEVVIAGTLGKSALVDKLVAAKLVDVSAISGRWEHFLITTVKAPLPGVERALVIVGADRRGTAFGLLTLSEAMGVSPWYWWADVNPVRRSALHVGLSGAYVDGPDVRYRGIFINDEGFGGLRQWASTTFDPAYGNIGPKTYTKVFELLLRLRANYLWPAMHPGTKAFNADPENARLADAHAIVMGSSHAEILLRNNEGEWKDQGTWGDYNFKTNRANMLRYWDERLVANGRYENTYTVGLRGLHDSKAEGVSSLDEATALVRDALQEQRALLAKRVSPDLTSIPQVLCAYKEVLPIYENGLNPPDDVTLLWADDNHGFIRNLSTPAERKRSGGSGVYYHLSYHGSPESWLWLSTLNPALLSHEMTKARDLGATRLWVFNVGDIKPAERELTLAMELAWDTRRWTPERMENFLREWSARTFGESVADDMAMLLDTHTRLAAAGKPEHSYLVDYARIELNSRILAYEELILSANTLRSRIPDRLKDAYDQLVHYPVVGAALLNRLHLLSRRSLQRAAEADLDALVDSRAAEQALFELDRLTRHYNETMSGGKWRNIMSWTPAFRDDQPGCRGTPRATPIDLAVALAGPPAQLLDAASAEVTPPMRSTAGGLVTAASGAKWQASDSTGAATFTFESPRAGKLALWLLASEPISSTSTKPADHTYWHLEAEGISARPAPLYPPGRLWSMKGVGPLWSRATELPVKVGKNTFTLRQVRAGATLHALFLGVQPPAPADPLSFHTAEQFSALHDGATRRLAFRAGLTVSGPGLTSEPADGDSVAVERFAEAPSVEFAIPVHPLARELEIRTLPTQRLHTGRTLRYAVTINGGAPEMFDIQADEYSREWRENVLRGYSARRLSVAKHAGKLVNVRIYLLDPSVVLDGVAVQ